MFASSNKCSFCERTLLGLNDYNKKQHIQSCKEKKGHIQQNSMFNYFKTPTNITKQSNKLDLKIKFI